MNALWKTCLIGVMVTCAGCGPSLTVSEVSSRQNPKVAEMTAMPFDDEEEDKSLEREFFDAITDGDFRLQKSLFEKHPEMLSWSNTSWNWVCMAVMMMKPELAKWLLDQGLDINWCPKSENTALVQAIDACDDDATMIEMVEYLLSRGANPNLGRPLIAAINRKNKSLNLPLLKLLVKHGADVNRVHTVYGDSKNLISALDFASGECEVYLRSVGAKSAVELAGKITPANSGTAISPADEVVNFFAQDVGPVDAKSLTEIVPDGTPINIHVIKAVK
jgi:hypothetical protein